MTGVLYRAGLTSGELRVERDAAGRAGLAAWNRQRALLPALCSTASREEQFEVSRLHEEYAREEAEILRWLAGEGPCGLLLGSGVVVAHRHEWVRRSLEQHLARHGVPVVAAVEVVADAVAALVVNQPAVLVTSDRLAGAHALELVTRLPELSPGTRCVVQVDQDGRSQDAVAAGAAAVLSHRAPVAELVDVIRALV